MTGRTDCWTLAVIVGLAGVTVLTRCFFFILDRPWALPGWAERALQYAPVAALGGRGRARGRDAGGQLVGDLAGRAPVRRARRARWRTSGGAACC